MLKRLLRHPDSRGGEGLAVEVDVARPDARTLALRYRVTGDLDRLLLPPESPPERADGLWRHTCFEAFLQPPHGGYYELNFAPSTQWAAYRFAGYRDGAADLETASAPRIASRLEPDRYELHVALALDDLPEASDQSAWRLGLSAVIEEAGGAISYWALAHAPGKPDFHHPDAFACDLPLTDT